MENVFLAESGSSSIIDAKKTAKKKYKCPYCEARIERSKLHIHIQDEHEDLIPEGYTALRVAFNAINHKTEGHCIICKGITDWNEDKARYERLCNNPACHEAYKKIVAERTKRIYGTERLQTDPEYADYVQRKALEGRKMSGKYTFADGGVVKYMGTYEKKFLEFMDTVMHAKSEDILAPGPSIKYKFEGQDHIYISDFFYVPYNLIVEIKDGGRNRNMHPKRQGEEEEKIKAKEKAVADLKMFNYVRVTDNDFGQLMTVMALLKYQLIHPTYNDYIIRVNEATSIGNDDQINDLIDVCKRMATYEYICIDDKFNVLQNSRSNFDKHRTVSSSNFKKCNGGICYDYVNYMVGLLGKFKFKTFFNGYVEKDGQIDYTHTYILVYINDKVYWIEDSWKSHMGVFEFDSEDDAISYIVNIQSKGKEYFVVEYKPSSKLVGISVIDFINIMNSKPEYNYKHNNSAKASTIYSVKLDSRGNIMDEKYAKVKVSESGLLEDMSGTIGAALPPAGARAPIVPTPSPMPYESDKDNYYVVQYPKNNVFAYGITKDPLQYSMVSVDPLEKGFYKVYKTDKGKINQKYLTFKIKDKKSGKQLYNELCRIADTTGKIFDSDIQSNYIYETLTEGSVILAPDQLLYDDRFELVDNPKDKLEKDMGKIYSWLKGGTLDKLQEQVDALASNQKGTDAYFVLPDGDLTLDQLKQWEHNYLMLSADDRIISNDISNEKYGADNLTRYKEKYSKLLQNSNPEKVDVSVDEASFMIPRVAEILDFDDKLDQVRRVECDSSILIMVLTDRGYGFDDYSDKDIDDLKEKWNRYNALPQEYRVLSSQTASNIFGLDNDGLFNKAINTYLARQQEIEAAEAEYPVDECVVPYFIPSNGVLKSNPNDIFDESGCINAYKYVKTLQELQHTLKCSKTEADREAIKEQIIDYGWNPEIPCTESALRKTYMRFEPKAIQEIDAKSFLEVQDATSEISDGLTSEYLKDKIVPIFVVLVHGNRLHSKGIRWFTDSEWAHSALSLDSSLDEMYTFTTDINNAPNKWHKTGFAIDTKERYLSEDPHMKVKVYALFITPEQKDKIASAIKWYIDHQDETSYGFKNILNIFMRRPTKRKMKSGDKCKMVCSQFVYTMLSLVNFKMRKSKDSSTISPADIDELSDDTRFYVVYQGGIDKYDQLKVDDLCYRLLPTLPMEMYGINESTGEAYGQPKSAIGKSDEIAKVSEMANEMLNDF